MRLIATSTTAEPGLTIDGVTSPGRPAAATSTSAASVWRARSRVCEWQTVTVAFACSSSCAAGFPTIWLRPITTARAPSRSIAVLLEQQHDPGGGRRHEPRPAEVELARVQRVRAVDVLARVDRAEHRVLVDPVRQRQLNEHRIDGVIGVQRRRRSRAAPARRSRRPGARRCRESGGGGGIVLEADVDLGGWIVADEHRRQPDPTERAHLRRRPRPARARRAPCPP